MRASIVVNNFNYERFLGQAIDSALGQTHPDVEVIVVDDGSTDRSLTVLERYATRIVALLQDNRGQTAALNAAMSRVTGAVVVFLDADDLLAPEAVEHAVKRLAEDPEVVKVHWPLTEIDADGRPLGGVNPSAGLQSGDLRDTLLAGGPEALVFPPTSGNAFRTSFLREELPLPEAPTTIGSASADAYLSMLAALRGRVAACDTPLGEYRIHGRNGFAGLPLADRLAHNRLQLDHRISVLAERCRALGLPADADAWRRGSWLHRLHAAMTTLRSLLAEDETFVLVDQGEWGTEIARPRVARPFVERDGQYWGPPADDGEAIAELERMRAEGARHIVFGWPAFWWLEHYAALREHLEARHHRVAQDDEVVVYELCG